MPSGRSPRLASRSAPRCSSLVVALGVAALGGGAGCYESGIAPCVHPDPLPLDAGLDAGPLPPVCRHIYVVDEQSTQLSAFDPMTGTFEDLGSLPCTPKAKSARPFSMSIARDDSAWVLYSYPNPDPGGMPTTLGELFHVQLNSNTGQGLRCASTPFAPSHTFVFDGASHTIATFGMGFSSDAPGSDAETLYIVGAEGQNQQNVLARVDLATFEVVPLALVRQVGSPELTGTGQAELWAFFPSPAMGVLPAIAQVDKATGATTALAPIQNIQRISGTPTAWAFAFWGGEFYVFLQRVSDVYSGVFRVGRATARLDVVAAQVRNRVIVGAGVSSCAPLTMADADGGMP